MSFQVWVLMLALIGMTWGEVMFWVTGDIIYRYAALFILVTNIPNGINVIIDI